MELMDISLERLYKTVGEKLGERLPEDIIGKVAYSVSVFASTTNYFYVMDEFLESY